MDVSDEMIRRARRRHVDLENAMFVVGEADQIPWDADFFTRAISVESAYYWPDPARGLREIFRVMREGGSLWVLINYYRENPHSHQWGEILNVRRTCSPAENGRRCFATRDSPTLGTAASPIPRPRPMSTPAAGFATPRNCAPSAQWARCWCTARSRAFKPLSGRTPFRWTEVQLPPAEAEGSHRKRESHMGGL